ncbi:MAG TPA: glycosyltransferase [Nanoarchaeota archaeon]|nr:glycosyltransferase [Nanoarchaeota archaeon]
MKDFTVSAVIPVYNREKIMAEVLGAMVNQSRPFDEIIVADDGSTDKTVEIAKTFPVRVVQSNHVERIAIRNTGLKHATGNIVAFIDSDLVLSKDWLKEVLKGFEQGYAAVVDRRQVYKPNTFVAKMNDHFFNVRYKKYKPFTAWIFKKDILEEVGGFNEQTPIGTEDVELADRLFASGHKIWFAKDAVCWHMGEPRSFKEQAKRDFWFGSNTCRYRLRTGTPKFYLKEATFTLLPFLLIKPLLFAGLFSLLYLNVFIRNILRGMSLKFLFINPIYMLWGEFAFTCGLWYGLLRKPAENYH